MAHPFHTVANNERLLFFNKSAYYLCSLLLCFLLSCSLFVSISPLLLAMSCAPGGEALDDERGGGPLGLVVVIADDALAHVRFHEEREFQRKRRPAKDPQRLTNRRATAQRNHVSTRSRKVQRVSISLPPCNRCCGTFPTIVFVIRAWKWMSIVDLVLGILDHVHCGAQLDVAHPRAV